LYHTLIADCVRLRVERRARLSAEEAVCERLSSDIAREHNDSGTVMIPQLQIRTLTTYANHCTINS
jgi:hypothetical protein